MKFLIGSVVALSAVCASCVNYESQADKGMKAYEAALSSGIHGNSYPGQFNRLYPDAVNFISYYSGEIGKPVWSSKTGLYQRYLLTLQVPIRLNSDRTKIISADKPTFY